MTVTVPESPATLTVPVVKSIFKIESDEEAQRVLDVAVTHVNRAFAGAFRTVDQITYDDVVRRVVGQVVGSKRRPTGGNGQLTRVENEQPVASPRDYLAPVRSTLAQYVVPL